MKHQIQFILIVITALITLKSGLHAQYLNTYLLEHPDQNFYQVVDHMDTYYADKDKGRGSGYKQYMQWRILTEPYVYPSGEMYPYTAGIFREYIAFNRTAGGQGRATHGLWEELGPMSYTQGYGWTGGNGRVNTVYVHPNNSSVLFVGTPAGGLWKSTNSGASWICLTDGMPTTGVSGFAVNYNNPNVLYILTGDGDGNNTPSIGVLKSSDGGQTWRTTGLSWGINWDFPNLIRAFKLIMHPTNPEILFVAASNGIWRTENGGQTWTQAFPFHTWDIEFKPGNPMQMYAAGGTFLRSANGGLTWFEDGDTDFPAQYNRIAIGVTPADSNYVYLLFGGHIAGTGAGTFSGFCRSTDGGADFQLMSNTPNILGYPTNGLDSANQAAYDLAIAIDPVNRDIVYTGGINVWKSTNGGSSWTIKSYWYRTNNSVGYTHADIHALEFDGTTMYCGSDGGIYKTTDGGDTWINLSTGLSIMQFNTIDVEGNIYTGGTWDNGCNQWTSSTTNATHTIGADGFACLIDYSDTNIRYQSEQDNKYKSTNGGTSFFQINPPGVSNYWAADWIMDPVDPNRLFVAQTDIWRTTNGGGTWTDLNAGFTSGKKIEAMAQGVNNVNRLYASDLLSMRRSDNALSATPSWTDISAGLPFAQAFVGEIAVDPNNSLHVWVSFKGVSAGNKVFYSPDGGNTWINESGSLPNVPVNCIMYEPGSNDGLYIGTDIGMFYKNDGIGDWIYYNNGLPTVRIFDLDIEGSYIYAATHGRGLWRSELYTNCPYGLYLTQANDPGNPSFTGIQRYHASHDIISSRIITGGIGTDVRYSAGSEIILSEGFHVRDWSVFEAVLEGCPE